MSKITGILNPRLIASTQDQVYDTVSNRADANKERGQEDDGYIL